MIDDMKIDKLINQAYIYIRLIYLKLLFRKNNNLIFQHNIFAGNFENIHDSEEI